MSIYRLTLLTAATLLAYPVIPVSGASTSVEAQYVGGTAKTIPANTYGTLNLQDSKELQFHYGTSVYRVAYDQITGSEILAGEGRHLFGRVPVPNFVPWKKRETFSISFHDSTGATGTLNFEVTSKAGSSAQSLLAARTEKHSGETAVAGDDDWWGDKWWKTNRNHDTWGSEKQKPAEAAQAAPLGATASK